MLACATETGAAMAAPVEAASVETTVPATEEISVAGAAAAAAAQRQRTRIAVELHELRGDPAGVCRIVAQLHQQPVAGLIAPQHGVLGAGGRLAHDPVVRAGAGAHVQPGVVGGHRGHDPGRCGSGFDDAGFRCAGFRDVRIRSAGIRCNASVRSGRCRRRGHQDQRRGGHDCRHFHLRQLVQPVGEHLGRLHPAGAGGSVDRQPGAVGRAPLRRQHCARFERGQHGAVVAPDLRAGDAGDGRERDWCGRRCHRGNVAR